MTKIQKRTILGPNGEVIIPALPNGSIYSENSNYSTTEKVIGKWTDNKPIYRKVIYTATPSTAGTNKVVAENPPDIDNMVRMDGMLMEMLARFPINSYFSSTYYISTYYNPSAGIQMICGSSLTGRACSIVLEYTKTTDVV